ncbi:MAG: hypothetical protein ACR2GR_07105 [Rhodothermales bacterium]
MSLFLGAAFGMAQEAQAQRKGFILGFGIGPGQTYINQAQNGLGLNSNYARMKLALATDFKIGYAPSEHLALHWFSNTTWLRASDVNFFDRDSGGLIEERQSVIALSGVAGLGVTYFDGPAPSAYYVEAGIGASTWAYPFFDREGEGATYGFGLLLGAGKEFARHWTMDVDVFWGRSTDDIAGIGIVNNTFSIKATMGFLLY